MSDEDNSRTERNNDRPYRREGGRPHSGGGYGRRIYGGDRREGGYRSRGGDRGGYRGRSDRNDHRERREYRPREGSEEQSEENGERREYRPRREGGYGHRDGGYRGHSDRGNYRGHSDRGNYRDRRDFKPRNENSDSSDENSERREYRPPRDYGDRPRSERGSYRERREYRPREEDSDSPSEDNAERREYRPRREGGYGHRDGGYRGRSDRNDRRERREYRPREGSDERSEDRPRRDYGDRPRREHSDRGNYRERREYRPRDDSEEQNDTEEHYERPVNKPKPVLTNDPQKMLFKGVDFQANGKMDLAMIMFLHGAVKMSKGCENNALNILRDMDNESIKELRTRMIPECSEDAIIEFDYLCYKLNVDYDRSFLDSKFDESNIHAIYCRIMLEELEGDETQIDTFAAHYDQEEEKVVEGLKYLKRKKDSKKAEEHLASFDAKKELRQSVRMHFIRAKKGEEKSMKELKKLSSEFPEAAFFLEYLEAKDEGNAEEWLIAKYPQFSELILSVEANLQEIKETPFGLFIRAKNIQIKKNEWIPPMIKAAKAGSELAIEELRSMQYRQDIKRVFATIYLNNNDLDSLLNLYKDGLDDVTYLDQYCKEDVSKILMVGERLGAKDVKPEIEWLVRNVKTYGYVDCKQALIKKGEDSRYQVRALIFALHDIGEDMEAAMLYFKLDWTDEVPSVKWLKKLCDDEKVKEYIQLHYEKADDLATFESIFVDDGYRKKPSSGRKPYGKKSFNKKKRY